MDWRHTCDLDWLKKRQGFITASDVKNLLPITKTGRPRTVTDLDRLKVMSGKMVELTDEDCWSYGVMARGHLLEPYALRNLNEILKLLYNDDEEFFWWDDEIITVPGRMLAFSPDGMNVPMTKNYEAPSAIAEVKSYSPERHIVTAYTPKDQIEERWQIASAMALLPNIDHAYLVLFNPKMKHRKNFVIRYDRSELEDEIAMVLQVEEDWKEFVENGILTKLPKNGPMCWSSTGPSEEEIMAEIMANTSRLNP